MRKHPVLLSPTCNNHSFQVVRLQLFSVPIPKCFFTCWCPTSVCSNHSHNSHFPDSTFSPPSLSALNPSPPPLHSSFSPVVSFIPRVRCFLSTTAGNRLRSTSSANNLTEWTAMRTTLGSQLDLQLRGAQATVKAPPRFLCVFIARTSYITVARRC